MKLLRYGPKGQEKPGCLDSGGNIRDLSEHTDDFEGQTVSLANINHLKGIDINTLPLITNNPRIGCALADTPNFFCVGLNYIKHAAEMGSSLPSDPVLFNKATSCLNGPFDHIQLPQQPSQTDWEVELGIVIGKEAANISEAEALGYVAGFCVVNDVSERDFQKNYGGQWVKGKSAPTFGPVGPYLVTPDDIPDVQNLQLSCTVNGEVQQNSNTSDMIFSAAQAISIMSRYFTLRVGDLIATGTPGGVGMGKKPEPQYLQPGDIVEAEIQELGKQRLTVLA